MDMTHYMELLATNQPWNLLIYMAIPVIVAETLAISELYLLFTKKTTGKVHTISRIAGIFGGIYFTGIFTYLFFNAVVPITASGQWRGFADVIAVGSYLAGIVPLVTITLLNLGLIYKHESARKKQLVHSASIGAFLVIAHIAMIFGMLSPQVTGWQKTTTSTTTDSSMSMEDMTADLKNKSGDTFDKTFLSEMIAHHQGALDMAKEAEANASHDEIKQMARAIQQQQAEEIQQMQQWQQQWGYSGTSSMMNGHSMHGM